MFGERGIPYQTVRYLRYLPRGVTSAGCNQFVLLLVECSYQVWKARCKAAYTNKQPGLHEVVAIVRKEIWFHLRREQLHLGPQRFSELWCRPLVIFKESGGKITVDF